MEPNIVILAGGISSRMKQQASASSTLDASLRKDAQEKSKAMIGVGDDSRPFLDYLLYNMERAGYEDVVIVVGERDDSIRRRYEGDEGEHLSRSMKISYAVQKIPAGRTKPLGTADALLEALEANPGWKGRKLTVCNSDNLYSITSLRLLRMDSHDNAMIDYDRSALIFNQERITQFAVIKKDARGFLQDIIEKPSEDDITLATDSSGRIGVSMNFFRFSYDAIYPFLVSIPLHPVRQEKELPLAVKMMVERYPGSMFTIPLSEHVPDLTTQSDILEVRSYLAKEFK
ncbi:MAG TPA: sugar phosphate nucleotidyltransferase [Bacteroidota bacterium]|nr:sugar phosphate nucleotidyltransferase [Bacteroidota bacterium]